MRKKLLFLYALLCLLPISAFSQTEFYYLPDAIDVSTLSNSSETKVVMHAGGSTVNKWIAANTEYNRYYYNDGFDTVDNTNANFIYTLVKDDSGNLSIRDSHNKFLPKWSGNAKGQFSNNQTSANVYNFTLSGDASNKQDADGNAYTLTGSDTNGLPIVYLTGNNRLGVNGDGRQTCESVTFQFFAVYDREEQGKAALNDFIEKVNAWKTAYADKRNNQATSSLQALNTALTDAQATYNNTESGLDDYKTAYNELYEAFSCARENYLAEAGSELAFKLRSLAHGGNLYLYVKGNDLKGVIIKDNPAAPYLRDQMFKFVKGSADGQYKIQCVAGNGFMQNSEGTNYWDIKCAADGEGSEYTVSYIGNNAYTISKSSGNYFSPDNTLKEDGTYIVYSNWGTANAWVLEPVSAEEVVKGNNDYYKPLYELYQTYLPYKNLYVAEKAGLPGYPTSYTGTAPALFMDQQLTSAETLLNNPTRLTANDVGQYSIMFPHVRDNLLADLVNYPENRYFSIKNTNNRGYLVYAADAPKGTETGSEEKWNYVWSSGKSYEVTSEAGTGGTQTSTFNITFDASNAAHLWCFLNHTKVDGTTEHYLYNVGFKKYARPTKVVGTYGGYTWVLTDEPAPITLKVYDAPNHKMAITAKSAEVASDTEVYASVSNDFTGPVISYYAQNDGGVPFTFDLGTKDFVASDTTDVAALVRTPITLRTVAKDQNKNPLITGLDNNQSICTYSSTKAFRVPAGVTAYYAKEKDAKHIVRLKAVPNGIVPANQGVILVGAVNKTKAMLDVDYRTEVTAESNIFRNTASGPTAMGDNCYVLANSTEGIGFYHATAGSTLSQGKAYLDFSGSSVRAFTLSFGDDGPTTGISSINADGNAENAPVYDLSGRRIAEPYGRGIYIKNGKKYFVK